jgi:hypothetical protein
MFKDFNTVGVGAVGRYQLLSKFISHDGIYIVFEEDGLDELSLQQRVR